MTSQGPATAVRITVDGAPVSAQEGDTLAAALLRAGITTFTRSVKYHRPRGPFCFAGSCGQCLVRVDGVPSVPACRVDVHEGLTCERQNAPIGSVDADVLRAVDFVFPGGLDHHHLMAGSRVLNRITLEVARRLAGLGELPDRAAAAQVPARQDAVAQAAVVVIGASEAGLSAARVAAGKGAYVVLIERDAEVGGSARLGLGFGAPAEGAAWADGQREALRRAGVEVRLRTEVVGLYSIAPSGESGPALLALRSPEGLQALTARAVVLAAGGAPQPLPFAGVDRPGVYAARGLLDLALRCGVRVGAPGDGARPALALVGEGAELERCAAALQAAGYDLARVVDCGAGNTGGAQSRAQRGQPLRARGNPVRSLDVDIGGAVERVRCDAVALALPPAPLHELASSVGADTAFAAAVGGFAVEADAAGQTRIPWLFVAGRAAGAPGEAAASAAAGSGQAAGEAAARLVTGQSGEAA